MSLESFTDAYIECALWSSLDDEGEPLDGGCYELSEQAREVMEGDAKGFFETHSAFWFEHGWSDEQAGHDFWLTRNGYGAGFWDRDREGGDELTEAAKAYGSCDLCIDDDGLIYAC